MTRPTITALALALALAACGTGSTTTPDRSTTPTATTTPDLPSCADMFAPGRPVADVVTDAQQQLCDDDGQLTAGVDVSWPCPDGTSIHQVGDFGWGRDGDVWQGPDVPAPYIDCVMPGTDSQHP